MTNQTTKIHTQNTNSSQIGATFPFDALNDCGAYICNWSGHLLRVPEDGVTPGRSPLINIVGNEPLTVTKISNDPYITITKAKLLASNFDIAVNF
jgi:hypothetical protein